MSAACALELITCNYCENPALRFCDDCQVELCVDCVSKHIDQYGTLSHEIVRFIDKNDQLVIPECKHHPGRRCEAFCQQCQIPVCTKCLIGAHSSHNTEDIFSIVENKKKEIKKETKKIEDTLLRGYRIKYDNIQIKLSKISFESFSEKQKNEKQRKIWHKMVDVIFDECASLIQSKKDFDKDLLETNQGYVKNIISDLSEMIKCNNKILESNKPAEIINFIWKTPIEIEEICYIDTKIPRASLVTKTGRKLEMSIELENIVASLSSSLDVSAFSDVPPLSTGIILNNAKLVSSIDTKNNRICRVNCVGTIDAWVTTGEKKLKRLGIQGEGPVDIPCQYSPIDIALTKERELVYSDNRTVNIVKQGKSEILINTVKDWNPRGLCCTTYGDILVSVFNTEDNSNKVVRYDGQKITQEIYKDENGKHIFKEGETILFLTENVNGDICVSDGNADKVVVVDSTGRFRFQYDGLAASKEESFDPRCIITDSQSHIIVSDMSNDCLHILDVNGRFLRCVDNCELDTPLGLSLDSKERLWVGLYRSGKIKVIRYLT